MMIESSRVVGTGSIGARYLRTLSNISRKMPVAVPIGGVLRDPELSKLSVFEDFNREDRVHVAMCVIASDTVRHLADYERFKGTADVLLVEKPLSYSIEALKEVDHSVPTSVAVVATPLRFHEAFTLVRNLIPTLGVITGVGVACRSWLPSWRPERDYRTSYSAHPDQGGVLLDLVHEIDYGLQLFGPPDRISANLRRDSVLDIPSESSAQMVWRYQTYDLVMQLDYASRPPCRYMTAYGTSKSLTWNILEASVTILDHVSGEEQVLNFPNDLDRRLGLVRQIVATNERAGDPRLSSLTQARAAMAVCDLAKESSAQNGVLLNFASDLTSSHAG